MDKFRGRASLAKVQGFEEIARNVEWTAFQEEDAQTLLWYATTEGVTYAAYPGLLGYS